MSINGSNNWNVSFAHISWFERLLATHANVAKLERHHDLIFEVDRKQQADHLTVFCCNQYAMGLTFVHRALQEFGRLDLIYIGGGWCGYTSQAKQFCLDQRMGLYVTEEMSGALWRTEYWSYHRKNQDGSPAYYIREA